MYRYTLATSFANRFTGVALSMGLLLLVYWLMAIAGGERSYARAAQLLALPLAKLVYAALIIAFSYHLVAGLRHLVWDTGRGLERVQSQRSAWIVVAVSIVLMLLIGWRVFGSGMHAP
jgi:succinate dehydrogenase / fumarate reductase cytochrome b subunit